MAVEVAARVVVARVVVARVVVVRVVVVRVVAEGAATLDVHNAHQRINSSNSRVSRDLSWSSFSS